MKITELIDELNNALREGNGSNRNNDYIQKGLTWEQWQELAPYMDFGGYEFEKLFEDMPDEFWDTNIEMDDLAWTMVDCAHYIAAALIDPYDNNRVNVIFANGIIEKDGGKDFDNRYLIVNV